MKTKSSSAWTEANGYVLRYPDGMKNSTEFGDIEFYPASEDMMVVRYLSKKGAKVGMFSVYDGETNVFLSWDPVAFPVEKARRMWTEIMKYGYKGSRE